jgi:hypothetical protein
MVCAMKREILTSSPAKPFLSGAVERKGYEEIIDFFARGPSPADVLAFQPSEATTDRVRYVLDRNAADELTEKESKELEFLGEVEHFMQLIKARARIREHQ